MNNQLHVVLLAAGISRRLAPYWTGHPKCLLKFGDKTLLEHHLDRFRILGLSQITVVTGYESEQITSRLASVSDLCIQSVFNPQFREGSIISLATGLAHVPTGTDILTMDADVLYETEVLRRIVEKPGTGFLIDETQQETGEEMMLGVRGGRVLAIARSISNEKWDLMGETVGFFRLECRYVGILRDRIQALIELGQRGAEYEAALQVFIQDHAAWAVAVGGLAWTEIDFAEDVKKANDLIFPKILARDGENRNVI